MNIWDILILAAVAGVAFFFLKRRRKAPGCCGRCDGCCECGKTPPPCSRRRS